MDVAGAGGRAATAGGVIDDAQGLDHSLFEQCPLAMWLADLTPEKQRIIDVNAAALELYGLPRESFLARPPESLEAGPTDPRALGGRVLRHERVDGRNLAIELNARAVLHGGRWLRLVVARDVTGRIEAEHALRESERRFRDVLENVEMISLVLDVEGRVTFINEYGARLLGWKKLELYGRDWFRTCIDAVEAEERSAGYKQRIRDGAIRRSVTNEVIARDGSRSVIAWNNTVLRDARGEITGTAAIGMDVTDQRRLEQQLWNEAHHDPLTGLPNRKLFFRRIAEALERARAADERQYAVLLLNVDRFKNVNDSLGHAVGDQLLAAIGRLLLARVRAEDTVARLSADEFAVLLDGGATDHERAAEVARSVQESLATPFNIEGQEVYSTVSIGIAMRSRTHEAPEDVVRDAHTALHRAKALGRARWEFFKATMRAGAVQRMRLENDLRRAMARHELHLAYQPIVGLRDGRLLGFEALVRWASPERGAVTPAEFIPVAEETGLIVPMGEYVLREACAQMAAWCAAHAQAKNLVVNVNVSGRQLSSSLVGQVDRAILDAGIGAQNLKLEITESVLMDSPGAAAALLGRIKERGVRICIDDFGTGYSSLGTLVKLPIDTMKIDRSFVSSMGRDRDTTEVVRSIAALAQSLKLDVVAEGVETEEQRAALVKLGCSQGQGYLFSRPLDGEQVSGLLSAL